MKKFLSAKKIIFVFITITCIIVIGAASLGCVFVNKIGNEFNYMQNMFANAHKMTSVSIDGKTIYNHGFAYDENNRDPDRIRSLQSDILSNKLGENNDVSTTLDYKTAINKLTYDMMYVFSDFGDTWDWLKSNIEGQIKTLKQFDIIKTITGSDYSCNNSGYIHDAMFLNSYYNTIVKNAQNPQVALLSFIVGSEDNPKNSNNPNDICIAQLIEKYFVKQFGFELGINKYTGFYGYNFLNPNINTKKITLNDLISLFVNRIMISSASALFTSFVTANYRFLDENRNDIIKKGNEYLSNVLIAKLLVSNAIHASDINVFTNILDALNYIMYYEASKIFLSGNIFSNSKDLKIYNEAKGAISSLYKSYIYYQNIDPRPYADHDLNVNALKLYAHDNIVKNLKNDLVGKSSDSNNEMGNFTGKYKDLLSLKNIISPDYIYTKSNDLSSLLHSFSTTYSKTLSSDQNITYFDLITDFWTNSDNWSA